LEFLIYTHKIADIHVHEKAIIVGDTQFKAPLILVVDDEWMNREMMQAYLEPEGYQVLLAHNGEEALKMIATRPPDLVLTDIRMQGISGYDICKRVKANPETQHVPVLLVTGLEREEDKLRGIEAGADDFVGKPLDAPVMLNRIKSLLRSKRLHDQLLNQEARLQAILARYLDTETAQKILTEFDHH
jgi:DNA-binding response OmpR family regulator